MPEKKDVKVDKSADKAVKKKNPHAGHRQKVRDRFCEAGFKGMPDHNVLEMLLFEGIPYKDTNEMAHELIEKFGDFAGVLEANRHDLLKIKGMTRNAACSISMILPLYNRYIESLQKRKTNLFEPEDIANYLRPKYFEGGCRERVFVLCYDLENHLLACRQINEGDFKSTDFDLREFARIVLETNCSKVIISHNHPHAIHLPSHSDIELTKKIRDFLEPFKVELVDHIIVSDIDYASMARGRSTMYLFFCDDEPSDDQTKSIIEYARSKRDK